MSSHGNPNERVLTPGTDGESRKTTRTNENRPSIPSNANTIVTQDRHGQYVSIDLTLMSPFNPELAEDLQDWLKITKWQDFKYRNNELARRRLEILEKEQAAIESKRAQIMLGYQADGNARTKSLSTPPRTVGAETAPVVQFHHTAPAASNKIAAPGYENGYSDNDDATRYYRSANREGEYATGPDRRRVDVAPYRQSPVVSTRGRSRSPRYIQRDDRYRARDYSQTQQRGSSPRRQPSPPPRTGRPVEIRIKRQPNREEPGPNPYKERREYREVKKESDAEARDWDREKKNFDYPKELSLGDVGNTRFFIMKSYNYTNVYDSQDDGVWATQAHNEDILRRAFAGTKKVVLFFSVNGSHAFQGYAVMKSLPSTDVRRPKWWDDIKWKITEPFEIDWISKMYCEDIHVKHIPNSLNSNLPCSRGRDCQEIEERAGRQMVAILESQAVREINRDKRRRQRPQRRISPS
ncbi:YT521-B-like domain-containing protein [Whalleya microplaca]|nr:YT521-B-like domain-containing protein [Whalleya microplaca]